MNNFPVSDGKTIIVEFLQYKWKKWDIESKKERFYCINVQAFKIYSIFAIH